MMEPASRTIVSSAGMGVDSVTTKGSSSRDQEIDLAPPYRRATMVDLIATHAGVTAHPSIAGRGSCGPCSTASTSPTTRSGDRRRLVMELYDEKVEPELIAPTFVIELPARGCRRWPKPHRDDPSLVERFELVVGGRELANAYSELNDPVDQLARFREEAAAKAAGDPEAGDVDLDYVRALEYGIAAHRGHGHGHRPAHDDPRPRYESIREVILFRRRCEPESVLHEAEFDDATTPRRPGLTGCGTPSFRARAIGWMTALGGILLVVSVLPFVPTRILNVSSVVAPFGLRVASHIVSLLVGVMLLFLAGQLRRKKHRAWQVAIGPCSPSASWPTSSARTDRSTAAFSLLMVSPADPEPP